MKTYSITRADGRVYVERASRFEVKGGALFIYVRDKDNIELHAILSPDEWAIVLRKEDSDGN